MCPGTPKRTPWRDDRISKSAGGTCRLCTHVKAKTPLTRGYAVPEVGLERDSRSCYCWEVAETCGIRASPAVVRASPGRKVWTMSTHCLCRCMWSLRRRLSGGRAMRYAGETSTYWLSEVPTGIEQDDFIRSLLHTHSWQLNPDNDMTCSSLAPSRRSARFPAVAGRVERRERDK